MREVAPDGKYTFDCMLNTESFHVCSDFVIVLQSEFFSTRILHGERTEQCTQFLRMQLPMIKVAFQFSGGTVDG